MPIIVPLTTVASSFRRRVGTPAASAAPSSSRMAARPKPMALRSIVRAMATAAIAIASMT